MWLPGRESNLGLPDSSPMCYQQLCHAKPIWVRHELTVSLTHSGCDTTESISQQSENIILKHVQLIVTEKVENMTSQFFLTVTFHVFFLDFYHIWYHISISVRDILTIPNALRSFTWGLCLRHYFGTFFLTMHCKKFKKDNNIYNNFLTVREKIQSIKYDIF